MPVQAAGVCVGDVRQQVVDDAPVAKLLGLRVGGGVDEGVKVPRT